MKKIFLICPVRKAEKETLDKIHEYVENLKGQGYSVYWPYTDTNQDDPIGTRICADNRAGIESADEVHIWWRDDSMGSLFDLGMAWALRKPLLIANKEGVEPTESKSFQNVLLNWGAKEAL